jgi:hypothetical protein
MAAAGDPRTRILLESLTGGPLTTSDLYDAVGYPALVRAGLVPYRAFREALEHAHAGGLLTADSDDDGATLWSLTGRGRQLLEPAT